MKVCWRYNTLDMNAGQLCIKIPKKRNEIKWPSIACSHICHADISKCVYQLDTYLVNFWWKYVLPNTKAAYFCDIIFSHRAMFSTSTNKESRESNIRPTTDNIYKITDRQTFLIFVWLMHMFHLALGPFFLDIIKKIVRT